MIRELIGVRAAGLDPAHNLAVEEYLTMHAAAGQCVLLLWQNERTVVIGRNQNAWKECDVRRLEADGGHLMRRLSGGGAVYHDLGNLNFTFCAASEDYDVAKQTEVILLAVRSLGIDAVRNGRNDLTVDGKKFSGHAYLKKELQCYHHGTLMVDVEREALAKYLRPDPQKLAGKGVDSVRARVANLRDYLPDLSIGQLAGALLESFGRVYGQPVQILTEEGLLAEEKSPLIGGARAREEIAQREAFFGSWDWRYGRPIPFQHAFSARYPWGGIEFRLEIQEGRVKRAAVHSDALEEVIIEACGRSMEGCRYDSRELERAILIAIANTPANDPALAAVMKIDLCNLIRQRLDH